MLPDDMRDDYRVWDSKTTSKVLTELARKHPDKFKEISHKILKFGAEAAYLTGGQSFSVSDAAEIKAMEAIRNRIEDETEKILAKWYQKRVLSDDPRVQKEIVQNTLKYQPIIKQEILKERKESPLYHQATGTLGNKVVPYTSIVGADLLYEDPEGRPVPVPITRGYGKGLTPVQYIAGAYGARKGGVDLQKATADAGFLAKQLVQIAHREVVTADDDPDPYDETNPRGYPADTMDEGNEGAYLAHPVGGYPRNTLLTPKILQDLDSKGHKRILVRSVTVGGPTDGGIYSYDAGLRESGTRPAIGDFVGISAVQAVTEPITQSSISCLHPNTTVRMADNTVKKLRDIAIGDYVLGSNTEGGTFPVEVVNIFHNGIQSCYSTTYKIAEGSYITVASTLEHRFLGVLDNTNKQIPIGLLSDNLLYLHDDKLQKALTRQDQMYVGELETMDIEVDHPDHLFVLANGMICSNSKHTGGVVGAGKTISGFEYLNQMIQVPQKFKHGAVHATEDGTIGKIEDAPQGGKYVYINGVRHYVGKQQGTDIDLLVKPGDTVEAGDVISDGIPNPAMVVKYKGIGEGRRAFVNQFQAALRNAGQSVHRRNLEALSRGLISYVRLTDELGDYVPDDVLPYAMVTHNWEPRKGFMQGAPKQLTNRYLEKPVLHYTVGTKLRPSVVKELEAYGVKNVYAHKDPPPFEPEMVRGMAHVANDPDWGTKMLGGYQQSSVLESARRGGTSYTEGSSYVPALAFGDSDFGLTGAIAPPDKRKLL
ncbi:MAG: hypothetical protein Q4D38_00115 [Planctomycetia bacterium]|nr:hypothetical protein [Planctomycetia bacterium]